MGKQSNPNPVAAVKSRQSGWLICLVLVLGTFALYWPVRTHGFVELDDPDYVSENPQVNHGFSRAAVAWAFRAKDASNWHPLTWLSHMLDCQLFGLNPGAHHLVNVGLHAANGVLLFLLLRLATGAFWRAAFVAACFAWHPLRVESVAWIAERKDVLSAFFGLLTLWAYVKFVRGVRSQGSGESSTASRLPPHASRWYSFALLCFALGLMSKPMLVTLPCLMLLLDFWPLGRCRIDEAKPGSHLKSLTRSGWKLVPEKIPFLALSAASCVLTIWAQSAAHSIGSTQQFPLLTRLTNAVVAVGKYVEKSIWPTKLAVFYPYSLPTPVAGAVVAGVFLLVVIWAAHRWLRERPAWFVGWFWFLGMLVPIIGLVQVGGQSWADRYSYLPGIGLLIALVWLIADLAVRWQAARLVGTAAVIVLGLFAAGTAQQVQVWRDSRMLFEHARSVTERNYLAWTVLGGYLGREGKLPEAIQHYETALQMQPDYPAALTGLGNIHGQLGEHDQALMLYDRALQVNPHEAEILNGRAAVLARQGRFAEAETGFLSALKLRPGYGDAAFNLGTILARQGRLPEALARLEEAVVLMPQSTNVHYALGEALRRAQRPADALAAFDRTLQMATNWSEVRFSRSLALMELGRVAEAGAEFKALLDVMTNRAPALDGYGFALAMQGQTAEAEKLFQEAIQTNPKLASTHLHYAMLLAQRGDSREAIRHYRQALDTEPNLPAALNNLAWMLATHPDESLRNGKDAVVFAQRACELTGQSEPFFLGTLAAAQAEAGNFPEAVAAAERAKEIATRAGRPDLAQRNDELLKFYQAGQPFRDRPTSR